MKRSTKKLLAVLLAVVMVLSQIPVLASAVEESNPIILHQPTFGEPYVEATGTPTGYQWYRMDVLEAFYSVVGGTAADGQIGAKIADVGSYDAETKVWKSDENGVLTVELDLDPYDTVYFGNFIGSLDVQGNGDCYTEYSEELQADVPVFRSYWNEEEPFVLILTGPDAFTAEITVNRMLDQAEEGQNKAVYQLTEPSYDSVYCVVSYENGTALQSDFINLGFECYDSPSASNPTALFSWDKYITGYQWYIREDKVHTWKIIPYEDNYERDLRYESSYWFDFESSQYVAETINDITYSPNAQLYLVKGDIVTFTMSDNYDGTAIFTVYGDDIVPYTAALENGAYTFTASENCVLEFMFEDDAEFTYSISVTGVINTWTAVEGETTNTLKSTKLGEYKCVASYKVGEDTFTCEDWMHLYLEIIKEPTEKNPTLEVNLPSEVKSYQWYTNEVQNKNLYVTPRYVGDGLTVDNYDGSFNSETKEWTPVNNGESGYYLFTEQWVLDGATLKVTINSEDFAGQVSISGNPISGENGVYTYTVEWNSWMSIQIESETAFTATIEYAGNVEVPVAVEGQNTATLKAPKAGEYYCVVTASNDETCESSTVGYSYDVITAPTAEKPTMEVTFPDQVKSYQWFTYVEKHHTGVITEEIDRLSVEGELQEDGTIKSAVIEPFKHVIMIQAYADKIKLPTTDGLTITGLYDIAEDGSYVASAQYPIIYLIIHGEEAFSIKPEVVMSYEESIAVEGQTTATYTGEKAGEYYCVAEYKDGEKVWSSSINYDPEIEKEPTVKKPTVVVTSPELVKTYQWNIVKETKKSDALKPEHVAVSYNIYKNNAWNSVEANEVHGILYQLNGSEGDKLTLNLPEGIEFDVNVDGGTYEDGVCIFDDRSVNVIITAEQAFTLAPKFDYTDIIIEPVADQTTDTLTPAEPGYYHCIITYQDGTELMSDTLDLTQHITQQPTDDAPVVEMMWPELVEKYQWYTVKYPVKNVTDAEHSTDSVVSGQGYDATFADGVWYAATEWECVEFVGFEVKPGMIIRVTAVGDTKLQNIDGMEKVGDGLFETEVNWFGDFYIVGYYDGYPTADDGVKVQVVVSERGEAVSGQTSNSFTGTDGEYLCVVTDKNGEEYVSNIISVSGYWFTQNPDEEDMSVKVNDPEDVESYQWYVLEEVLAVRPVVPENPTDDEVEAWFNDNLVYHNNKWYAINGSVESFGLDLNKGDQVIITPDENFNGAIGTDLSLDAITIEEKDGSYIITLLEDSQFVSIHMYQTYSSNSFTFTAQVKGTKAIAKKVEGAVSATLAPEVTGEYFCVVTMKDGTKLSSAIVKYEKPADPPAENDPIPPTGEGMNLALVSCIAALSVTAILALGWDTKRKF